MNLNYFLGRVPVKTVVLGLCAFAVLTVRFSPNWWTFCRELRDAKSFVTNIDQGSAIEQVILGGFSERGFDVIQQARDLSTEIANPNHKIVRWRLLVPVVGHFLSLPGWVILGLAHLGCLLLIMALIVIGAERPAGAGRHLFEAWCLVVIAGANAAFFASMGWLGYYDSWLALVLLGVGFARKRWVVLLACVLGPWIDERFVIGLPLALLVRKFTSDRGAESLWAWFKTEALVPLGLVLVYSAVRLSLGGNGGSQTVGDYLHQFVFAPHLSVARRLFGAWSGLRFGWIFVLMAMVGCWMVSPRALRLQGALLALGVIFTAGVGVFSALDLSRSMVLIFPVVPLGWIFLSGVNWWSKFYVGPLLALATLLLPANQVVGNFSIPVDNLWSPSRPLLDAENNLGVMFERGNSVLPANAAEAIRWYQAAAEHGYTAAQSNLGALLTSIGRSPKDRAEALKWCRIAAEKNDAAAQYHLGVKYAVGDGLAKDEGEAVKWFRRSAEQGNVLAQFNLAVMYAKGAGVAKDPAEVVKWLRRAAEQGDAIAQENLGMKYAAGEGVSRNLVQAHCWLSVSRISGQEAAAKTLVRLEQEMTVDQILEAENLAREYFEKHHKP